jgi:hypothetical protein
LKNKDVNKNHWIFFGSFKLNHDNPKPRKNTLKTKGSTSVIGSKPKINYIFLEHEMNLEFWKNVIDFRF